MVRGHLNEDEGADLRVALDEDGRQRLRIALAVLFELSIEVIDFDLYERSSLRLVPRRKGERTLYMSTLSTLRPMNGKKLSECFGLHSGACSRSVSFSCFAALTSALTDILTIFDSAASSVSQSLTLFLWSSSNDLNSRWIQTLATPSGTK